VIGREDAPPLYYDDVDPDGDFHPPADVDAEADLAAFRTECDRSRALVAAQPSLEVTGKGPGGPVSLRWILLHMTRSTLGTTVTPTSCGSASTARRGSSRGISGAAPDTLNLSRESPRLV